MELLELASRLVAFDTVSSETTVPMAGFIAEYLRRCGFEIEEYPYVVVVKKKEGDKDLVEEVPKVNLIARKGGPDSRLVLAGHMDTVPVGKWKTDPWKLTLQNNNFHGLGIADMKIFLAIAMKAGEAIPASELRHPFALCFTSDEEVGCLGAKKLVEQLKRSGRRIGDYVVIGEPTLSRPVYAHKGYIYLEVSVEALRDPHSTDGNSENPSHSSDPRTTTNTVEKTLPTVIEELSRFRAHLENVRDRRFDPDYPTMNIGGVITVGRKHMSRGDQKDKAAKNIIPRGFTLECEIRPVPGQNPMDLIEILERNINERILRIRTTVPDEKFHVTVAAKRAPTYPMETRLDSPVIRWAEQLSGHPAETVAFNTEGGIYNRFGSETVVWGPADILEAHKNDECVPAEMLREGAVEPYIRLIRAACVEGR